MHLRGLALDDTHEKEPAGVLELVLREQEDRNRRCHGEMAERGTELVRSTCHIDARHELDTLSQAGNHDGAFKTRQITMVMKDSSPLLSTKLPSTASASFSTNP